jgi:site-specific DNA-methyltransferase (adenine-specific)
MNFYHLYHGDCLEVLSTLEDQSIDCMIVDPPYSSGAVQDTQRTLRGGMLRSDKFAWFTHDNMSTNGFTWLLRHLLILLRHKLKPNAHGYIFSDWRQYLTVANVLESTGYILNNVVIWNKRHFGMGTHFRHQHEFITFFSNGKAKKTEVHGIPNILSISNVPIEKRVHPTQKPITLITTLLKLSTTNGDVVLDPMCGSGSVMEAAQHMNCSCVGIEIDPYYCDVVKKRCFNRTFLDRDVTYRFFSEN